MAKVLQLTSCHSPNDGRIFLKTARSLAAVGHEVVLLAPNAEQGTRDGVMVKGFPASGGRLRRFLLRPFTIFRRALAERADIVHFHDPDLLPVGIALRLSGTRVIYDVHEDYAAAVYDRNWIPSLAKPFLAWLIDKGERLAVRFFSAAIAATPTIELRFPAQRTIVTNNYPLARELVWQGSATPWGERHGFVYVGGISRERGMVQVLSAMQILNQEHPCQLALAGVIPDPTLGSEIHALNDQADGWLDYRGVVDRSEVSRMFAHAIGGLVTFLPAPNHVDSQPTKFFEYMSAGLPVIASNFPTWRRFLEEHRCGLTVDPEDPQQIASALRYLIERPDEAQVMGRRGQKLVRERLNWSAEEKKLLALYDELLGRADSNVGTVRP